MSLEFDARHPTSRRSLGSPFFPNCIQFLIVVDLQVHLSFSQLGGAADDSGGSVLSLLLQSVGVAVTEVQDVEFK